MACDASILRRDNSSPCGDDDLVDPDRHSEAQISLRDLSSKIDAARRKTFDRGPGV
jgi:hypothetical protein